MNSNQTLGKIHCNSGTLISYLQHYSLTLAEGYLIFSRLRFSVLSKRRAMFR